MRWRRLSLILSNSARFCREFCISSLPVFLFGLGLRFRDDLTPVFVVCVFLLFRRFHGTHRGRHSAELRVPAACVVSVFSVGKQPCGSRRGAIIGIGFHPLCFSALPGYARFVSDPQLLAHYCADLSQTGRAVMKRRLAPQIPRRNSRQNFLLFR